MSASNTQRRVSITMRSEDGIPNSYIVTLKDGADRPAHMSFVEGLRAKYAPLGIQCEVTTEFRALNGYWAKLGGGPLEEVAQREDVKAIHQDVAGKLDMYSGNDNLVTSG
ncbi:unnamed protein product [Rhizoctonia solani]|uniref:Uncharacterized protein n=1 Tax=Rhizoctonia solani TaxID=456999 RepID=A0A8H3BI22_9AGAM|nr:unnamed protein product [Rhizoctonia solani]